MPLTSYPKEKIKILLLENISNKAVMQFHENGYQNIVRMNGALDEDKLVEAVKDVHILGIRSKTRVTPRVLAAAKKLQSVGCFCIGVNQVDLDEALKKGVAVFNAPYSNTRSVAELVIGLAILLIRKIPDKNKAAHEGIWLKDARGSFELRGKTMGLIGYGNIGSQVSVMAEALGLKVVYYDTETKLPLGNARSATSLTELLKESDIVSLHVPENAQTKNLINRENIVCLKNTALLINYSRGEVVDLDALSEAIRSGKLAGAAVDVFPVEPENNGDTFSCPLQGLPNVILTPHIGGSTVEAQENIGLDVSHKLLDFLERGNSTGSVTIPAIALPPVADTHRILHIHRNTPGVLSAINTELSNNGINILSQFLKTNETTGYVVLDVDKKLSKKALDLLKNVSATIKVRLVY